MNEKLSKKDKEMLIANSMKAVRDGESKKAFLKNTKFIIDGMIENNYNLEEENFDLKHQLQSYKEKEDKIREYITYARTPRTIYESGYGKGTCVEICMEHLLEILDKGE